MTFPGSADTYPEATGVAGKDVLVPPAFPPEVRRRAVELFRERDKPAAALAAELGISESCLRR